MYNLPPHPLLLEVTRLATFHDSACMLTSRSSATVGRTSSGPRQLPMNALAQGSVTLSSSWGHWALFQWSSRFKVVSSRTTSPNANTSTYHSPKFASLGGLDGIVQLRRDICNVLIFDHIEYRRISSVAVKVAEIHQAS